MPKEKGSGGRWTAQRNGKGLGETGQGVKSRLKIGLLRSRMGTFLPNDLRKDGKFLVGRGANQGGNRGKQRP